MPGPTFASKQSAAKSPQSDERKPSVRRKPARASNFVQHKLAVGPSDDTHEREADRAAEHVVARNSAPALEPASRGVRRVPADERKPEPPRISRAARPSAGAGGGEVPAEVESRIAARRGGGRPLDPVARTEMEQGFQRDFSAVRVHDDPGAAALSHELGARAFTLGNDVFFASGEHAPGQREGRRLLAHELAHVAQQDGANVAAARLVQRTNGGTPAGNAPASAGGAEPAPTAPTLVLGPLKIPKLKGTEDRKALYESYAAAGRLARPQNYSSASRGSRQSEKWMADVAVDKCAEKIRARLGGRSAAKTYLVRPKEPSPPTTFLIGTPAGLAERFKRPSWNRRGKSQTFQVDHVVEMQVGGRDELPNYEMLEANANRDSGEAIKENVDAAAKKFLSSKDPALAAVAADRRTVRELKQDFRLAFDSVVVGGAPSSGDAWTRKNVVDGDHADFDELLDLFDPELPQSGPPFKRWPRSIALEDVIGSPGVVPIYRTANGGVPRKFNWRAGESAAPRNTRDWIRGFAIEKIDFDADPQGDVLGRLRGRLLDKTGTVLFDGALESWEILRVPGLPHAGYIAPRSVEHSIRTVFGKTKSGVPGMSPIEVEACGLDDDVGVFLDGRVLSTVPLLRDADIRVRIEGDEFTVFKVFDAGELAVPGPVHIDGSSLIVSVGTKRGIQIDGLVRFSIDRVGTGELGAAARTGTGHGAGFALGGRFEFDPELFDAPSYVELAYRDGKFSGGGRLTIGRDRVRGVKSASVQVAFDEQNFSATGDAQLDIPGVERGTLAITKNESDGFVVGGAFQLADDIPGLRGGSLDVKLQKKPDAEGWAVFATGTAQPNVPGVDTTLTVAYADGLLTVAGSASYERGMLKGGVTLGATNRAIGPDGQPTGDPGKELTVYGGGQLTIRVAPWLQGTVGVRILPNGEIEVIGEVALPSTLEVFPEQKVAKSLLDIDLDIPIVGVSVAGQRIGIFATIGGALDFDAGFGPGQLQNCRLGVQYNPAHEDQTRVTGGADFVIPAHAGLKLTVQGGLGVGIPIVSATAKLAVSGEVGLIGATRVTAAVDWTPTTGLRLDAVGELFGAPKFAFRVFGVVDVIADLWIAEIELYHEEWDLANFEYGSNLRFGVRFPVEYREGEPFGIALDRIELVYPNISPRELLEGLVDRIN